MVTTTHYEHSAGEDEANEIAENVAVVKNVCSVFFLLCLLFHTHTLEYLRA